MAIALVVPDLTNPYFTIICRAAQQLARERGYEVLIFDTLAEPEREREIVRSLSSWVDGVVICAALRAHRRLPGAPPIVYVNRRVRGSHCVMLDQRVIVDLQIRHLVELGHEHIAWIGGPKDYWASEVRQRHAQRWAARRDIRILSCERADYDAGVQIAQELPDDVTAVAAFNDREALGIISRAQELSRRVPEDLSVVGSDDMPDAVLATPRLTTVHAPIEEMARTSVSLLLDHLHPSGPEITATLRGELVARESTGPPKLR